MAASSYVSSSSSSSFDRPATGGLPPSFPNLELILGGSSHMSLPKLASDTKISLPRSTKKGLAKTAPQELGISPSQFKQACDFLSKNHFPAKSFYQSSKTSEAPLSFLCHRRKSRTTVYLSPTSLHKSPQATIKLATTLKGKTVALKLIPKAHFKEIEKEVYHRLSKKKIAKQLFVIGPHFEYQKISKTEQRLISKVALVLPYKPEGTLVDFVNHYLDQEQRVPEKLSRSVCAQLAEGAAYLHQQGIVHLDLKLENCLIETREGEIKVLIADFGHASLIGSHVPVAFGSLGYRDPVLFRKPLSYTTVAQPSLDVWSAGMVMSIIANSATFQHWTKSFHGDEHYLADMREDSFEYYKVHHLEGADKPTTLNWVISQCLQLDPAKRMSASQAAQSIKALPPLPV